MKNFALIGVGGYIAPRHIEAINKTGNRIVAAFDVNDSVGILDRYTQDVAFFTDFERFESQIDDLKGTDKKVDYLSICSPNYLHASHIKFGLKNDCEVICEKPLVLFESEIDELKEYEKSFNRKVNTVLQLRVHDAILKLKEKFGTSKEKHEIDLTYITSRGPWYHESWKGDLKKSGGLASNIGVHFFDMLSWVFGDVKNIELHKRDDSVVSGYLQLENANVSWFLSVDSNFLPADVKNQNKTTFRSITVDGEEIEFSGGFTDLHTRVYEKALSNEGFSLEDSRGAISLVEKIRFLETKNLFPKHKFL